RCSTPSGGFAAAILLGEVPEGAVEAPSGLLMDPVPAVLLDQPVRGGGSPGAGRVVREVARGRPLPCLEDRRRDPPRRLDHVAPVEERGVADHAVVEEALVTGRARRLADI